MSKAGRTRQEDKFCGIRGPAGGHARVWRVNPSHDVTGLEVSHGHGQKDMRQEGSETTSGQALVCCCHAHATLGRLGVGPVEPPAGKRFNIEQCTETGTTIILRS